MLCNRFNEAQRRNNMGQYRLAIYARLQLGILFAIEKNMITISIPFIDIYIGLHKEACGYRIFNWFEN
jgi:hypothetical protein